MHQSVIARAALVVAATLASAGCVASGSASGDVVASSSTASSSSASASSSTAAPVAAATPERLIGPDCGRYADPATARRTAARSVLDVVRDDPRLTWFASALTGGVVPEVDYTRTLAGGDFTVFAPTDAAVDEAVRRELAGDPATLRFFLDYHLVPGRALSPQQLLEAASAADSATVQTLQGWGLTAFAAPESPSDPAALRLSEDAVAPVCGNITTAGARLYLVPALLHPAGDYAVPGASAGGGGSGGGEG